MIWYKLNYGQNQARLHAHLKCINLYIVSKSEWISQAPALFDLKNVFKIWILNSKSIFLIRSFSFLSKHVVFWPNASFTRWVKMMAPRDPDTREIAALFAAYQPCIKYDCFVVPPFYFFRKGIATSVQDLQGSLQWRLQLVKKEIQ